jgi:dipeptidyl aminopeptidase/acylaminoacyl peptidase
MAAFNAAQMMGVPSRMLLFPEENHWILRPQNAVHWQRDFFAWFDQWLKD